MVQTDETLMTTDQVATLLQVANWTVITWRKNGAGPPWIRVGTRAIRYRRTDVETWIESRTVTAGQATA